MKRVTETFLLSCTVDRFWDLFLDDSYVRALYLDGLGFKGMEILEKRGGARTLRVVPKLNLPEALARLIGDAFAYEEHGVLDRAKSEWTWHMVQPVRSLDVVSTSGSVRVEATEDGRCRRTDELTISGKLFGLGRLIEAAAEKEARAAWGKELPFFEAWVKRAP